MNLFKFTLNHVRLLGDWRQAHASDVNGLVQGHAYTITGKVILYMSCGEDFL